MMRRLLCGVLAAAAVMVCVPAGAMAAEGFGLSGEGFKLHLVAMGAQNQNGSPDVQAGSHPYALTTTFMMNEPKPSSIDNGVRYVEGNPKDVKAELPTGFVGDPEATPRCTQQEFIHEACPNEAAVGISTVYIAGEFKKPVLQRNSFPLYNLVPPKGDAAEFAFFYAGLEPVFLYVSVRTGGDYGLTVTSPDISQAAAVLGVKVTVWGVPAAPAHDKWRGKCLGGTSEVFEGELEPGQVTGFTGAEAEQEGSYF